LSAKVRKNPHGFPSGRLKPVRLSHSFSSEHWGHLQGETKPLDSNSLRVQIDDSTGIRFLFFYKSALNGAHFGPFQTEFHLVKMFPRKAFSVPEEHVTSSLRS
jgi:hypothetical protein